MTLTTGERGIKGKWTEWTLDHCYLRYVEHRANRRTRDATSIVRFANFFLSATVLQIAALKMLAQEGNTYPELYLLFQKFHTVQLLLGFNSGKRKYVYYKMAD